MLEHIHVKCSVQNSLAQMIHTCLKLKLNYRQLNLEIPPHVPHTHLTKFTLVKQCTNYSKNFVVVCENKAVSKFKTLNVGSN